jgi:DNA damage-inducible protein 1
MDSLESLKYIIEAEFNIPTFQQYIKYENKFLENEKLSIKNYNIKDDEILVVGKRQEAINLKNNLPGASSYINTNKQNNISKIFEDTMQIIKQNPQGQGGQRVQSLGNNFDNLFSFDSRVKSECVKIKELYTNNPDELNYLFFQDPKLAEIIVSMDDKALEEIVRERLTKIEEKRKKESDEYNKLWSADPNDPESQKKIEEFIRLKNIEENFKMAQEYLPESLLSVHMLFINLEINKHKIVALVDTGAQSTIISEDLAKRFGIFNLCDTRYSGIAKGVGTSKILGIIHAALMKIGDKYSFNIKTF